MTAPNPNAAALRARRVAFIRALMALFCVIVGVITATVGAFIAWGLAMGLVFLGGSLFALGITIAVIG